MNRLDNLPVDIIKIINRKVEDIHIEERRIERKKNRAENRLMRHKKKVEIKFINLVLRKRKYTTYSNFYSIRNIEEISNVLLYFEWREVNDFIYYNDNYDNHYIGYD